MTPAEVFDRLMGLDRLQDDALMTIMLNRDPFDVVTWAKLHLQERVMSVGDKLAYGLLYDKQNEICTRESEES